MKEKLFNLHLFNPKFAVFPQQVFKEKFDFHYFMYFNGWFNDAPDFDLLRVFLEAINEPFLYCSVPDFYNCPDIAIDMSLGHSNFVSQYLMEGYTGHINQHIGLRISPEGFWHGKSCDWAMVSDVTNDIIMVGLKADAALNFRADFEGKYFDIKQVIQNMEEFEFTMKKRQNPNAEYIEMDGKLEIIELWS